MGKKSGSKTTRVPGPPILGGLLGGGGYYQTTITNSGGGKTTGYGSTPEKSQGNASKKNNRKNK